MDEKNKGLVIGSSIIAFGCALVAVAILMAPQPSPANVTMGGDTNTNPAPVVVSGLGEVQKETQIEFGGTTHHDSMLLRNDLTVTDNALIGGDLSVTGTIAIGGGTAMDKVLRTTVTVNPNSLAAGGSTSTVLALTGVATADHCLVNSTSGDLAGTTSTAQISCRFTATDTATIYYYNATGTSAFDAGPNNVLSVVGLSF